LKKEREREREEREGQGKKEKGRGEGDFLSVLFPSIQIQMKKRNNQKKHFQFKPTYGKKVERREKKKKKKSALSHTQVALLYSTLPSSTSPGNWTAAPVSACKSCISASSATCEPGGSAADAADSGAVEPAPTTAAAGDVARVADRLLICVRNVSFCCRRIPTNSVRVKNGPICRAFQLIR
jgi:hypothetical protein